MSVKIIKNFKRNNTQIQYLAGRNTKISAFMYVCQYNCLKKKTLNKQNNSNYPYVSKDKSDSVEKKGKPSHFHCDECEYSYEEKNN